MCTKCWRFKAYDLGSVRFHEGERTGHHLDSGQAGILHYIGQMGYEVLLHLDC